uniref:BTB domain-containing protein n=1 Tax=Aegilops tauschii subsp. strangulata TaxID=200361 RepID=A0A453RLV7_AEGTS
IFLELMSKCKGVKAIFEAFVVDKDAEPFSSHAERCVQVYPPEGFDSWGWPQFAKRSDLESQYVVNGWVTIVWGVVVVRDDSIAVPSSDIENHLGRLLDCGDGSDVSFVVDGETFPAHRAVLAARSPVFKAELFGSMAESTMSRVTLEDIDLATFKVFLRFIYTDALPGDDELEDSLLRCMSVCLPWPTGTPWIG